MNIFVCNANTFGNIDYGKPILEKQADYRTSTGNYHRHIPEVKTEYYPVKPNIAASNLKKDVRLLNELYKTTTGETYDFKYKPPGQDAIPGPKCDKTLHLLNAQEKIFMNPPPPMKPTTSEVHSEYTLKKTVNYEYIRPVRTTCLLSSTGGDEQPRIQVESTGSTKLMDPYISTSRLNHYPFTQDQIEKGSARNTPTFYTATNEPSRCTSKEPVYDRVKFKKAIKDRIVPRLVCRVPHFGISTEYRDTYIPPSTSEFFSSIFDPGTEYPDSFSGPNLIQSLTAPGMYCTEYCHIGTGWPPRAIVDPRPAVKEHITRHIPCTTEIY